MRIATHNVNGIRATLKRGFREFWSRSGDRADVLCLQEVRCRARDLPLEAFDGWHATVDLGQLAGRNGVAVLTRTPPSAVRTLHGGSVHVVSDGELSEISSEATGNEKLADAATHGRYLEVELSDVPITVASLYLPKGSAWPYDGENQPKYEHKMRFLSGLAEQLCAAEIRSRDSDRGFVIVGDFNIARTENDLKNWRANRKSEGFLPEERQWFSELLEDGSFVDVQRRLVGEAPGPYSWWSWRGKAFENDAGWRIDYQLATASLAAAARSAHTHRETEYSQRMSDHSPVIVDYDLG